MIGGLVPLAAVGHISKKAEERRKAAAAAERRERRRAQPVPPALAWAYSAERKREITPDASPLDRVRRWR